MLFDLVFHLVLFRLVLFQDISVCLQPASDRRAILYAFTA